MECLRMHECELCEKAIVCDLDKQLHNGWIKKTRLDLIKNFIVVNSNKGGLGATLFSIQMATKFHNMGYKTALLETSMSSSLPYYLATPTASGLELTSDGILPIVSKYGFMYLCPLLFMQNDPKVVNWDLDAIFNFTKKMLINSNWGDIDVLILDVPLNQTELIKNIRSFTDDKISSAVLFVDHKRYKTLQTKMYINYVKEFARVGSVLFSPSKKKSKAPDISIPDVDCPVYTLPYVDAVSFFETSSDTITDSISGAYAGVVEEVVKRCLPTERSL
ncbi:MAG: P-loop NTPase [Pseudomonadota bacterium]